MEEGRISGTKWKTEKLNYSSFLETKAAFIQGDTWKIIPSISSSLQEGMF